MPLPKTLRVRQALRLLRRPFRLSLYALLGLCLLAAAAILLAGDPDPWSYPVSPALRARDGSLIHLSLSERDEWLAPLPLSEMGPFLPMAAVAVEDRRFRSHPGVDPLAILGALSRNLRSPGRPAGASTITAQVVRILEPRPRTIPSKFLEFAKAVRLEARLGKDRILELYLNLAPFGGNLRGVQAASLAYFGKAPKDLSLGEAALLVGLLKGPSLYRPDRRPGAARARRDHVLGVLLAQGLIGRDAHLRALGEPVGGGRAPLPRGAPHRMALLGQRAGPGAWALGGGGARGIPTSIDKASQAELTLALRGALSGYPQGVTAAGVVIDNATGEVIAYQGNAREGGTHPYVDCARARRSTGSALKPLVYLLAFSKGALNPWSLLADTPQGLVGLAPRNFSGSHRGPVSARVALAESLNVPAVRVLRLVGQDEARGFLESFGLGPFGPRDYGDSLVLGGAEASLLELARAYSALARGGRDIPPTFSPAGRPDSPGGQPDGGAGPPGAPGLAPEAAVWLLNRSLSDDGRLPPALRGEGRPFKTGTSHGLRDAWFFMWSPGYTVALWMGDPSGAGHRELSGARALSGAAVGVTRALADKAPFPGPPKGLRGYLACPVSGGAATPLCPGAVKAYGLASHPRPRPCAVHVLSGGRPAVRWPSELRDFMGAMGGLSPGPQGASVVSPRPGGTLLLSPASTHVPLRAEGAAPPVHWYVDRRFLGEDRGVPPLWALRPGEHEVSFIDARGRVGSGSFTVRGAGERGREGVPALEFQ